MIMLLTASLVALGMLVAPNSDSAAVPDVIPVTACGQHVASGKLVADLDCSSYAGNGVVLGGGTLDLAGFTLTAGTTSGFDAVRCHDECTVVGPGTIVGGEHGINVTWERPNPDVRTRKLKLYGAVVRGARSDGVTLHNGNATIFDAIIEGNGRCAVSAINVKVADSTIEDNGCGIEARRASISTSEVSRNSRPQPASGPRNVGVNADQVRVRDSILVGNISGDIPPEGPQCDLWGCGDIRTSGRKPKLRNVQCDTSLSLNPIDNATFEVVSWNLCSHDSDFDQDGTENALDTCDANLSCALQDADADGFGDCCDNCPADPNPGQGDTDTNGIGDQCE